MEPNSFKIHSKGQRRISKDQSQKSIFSGIKKRLNKSRRNSSPENKLNEEISKLDISAPNFFSISRRKQNMSSKRIRNLRRPQTQSKERDEESLPNLKRSQSRELKFVKAETFKEHNSKLFDLREAHFAKTPSVAGQQNIFKK